MTKLNGPDERTMALSATLTIALGESSVCSRTADWMRILSSFSAATTVTCSASVDYGEFEYTHIKR